MSFDFKDTHELPATLLDIRQFRICPYIYIFALSRIAMAGQ